MLYRIFGRAGSGKSTTEKLICGHLVPDGGKIKLFGKDYTDPGVRVRVGALIENAGCFPGSSVWDNLMMQAINLGLKNPDVSSFFFGTGILIIGAAAILGNNSLLNIFLYGSSVYACLSSSALTVVVCLVVSVVWAVIYNVLGTVILSKSDVY